MKRINYIGLDMDHTLVRYKSENFEALAHKIMCDKLVKKKGYPQTILKLPFEFNRAIRGLVIDKAKGNLLKLSRHTAIRQSYHGQRPISFSEQNKVYKSTYIDIKDKNFDKVDTTFSISYALLFAQIIDLKDSSEKKTLPDYLTIAENLNEVLDEAHRDGSLKSVVAKHLPTYIIKDRELLKGIERYRKHGKKFFIVTNSDYDYASLLLDYAINPFVKSSGGWRDIFTYVIVSAHKPSFFFEQTPFQKIDTKTGEKTTLRGEFSPGVYAEGNALTFTNKLDINPDEILYIGDHIYGDIVRLKKDCAWRTALVVEELDHEVKSLRRAQPIVKQINSLMAKKLPLEIEIDKLISQNIEKQNNNHEKKIGQLIHKSSAIDKKIAPLIRKQSRLFNPFWGEVMRVGIEESYFAYQVERFACIYMSRLTDLMTYSPRTYFRSIKRPLPHEL